VKLALPGDVTATGLALPENLSIERWLAIGEQLKTAERSLMWWIGDWLRFGERKYGEMYAQGMEATGLEYQTLADAKWVAEQYQDFSLRNEILSWSHHRFAAALPAPERAELLEQAEREEMSAHDVRAAVRRRKITQQIDALPVAPAGLFDVIVIDPPWPYDDGDPASSHDKDAHRASNPYPEMSLEKIAAIELPVTDNCVLWLWTTHRFMRHAFPLFDAWGFEEKAIVTWVKDRMGLGRWLRSQSEFCIMAIKGSPVITLTNQTTVINGPMRQHSRKPDEFYAMVDALCHGRKLDYFSREPREGWQQFGNDLERFAA